MRNWYFVTAGLAAILSACSSVDQVPLVYVSTAKVGVSVESGSAETPGASLMIGVDLTDAAYVPVAFARRCDGQKPEMMKICAEDALKIATILGKSADISEQQKARLADLRGRLEMFRLDLNEAEQSLSEATEAQQEARENLARSKLAQDNVEAFEDLESAWYSVPENLDQEFPYLAQLNELRQLVDPNANLTFNQAVAHRNTQKNQRDQLRNKLWGLIAQLEDYAPDSQGKSDEKTDALSVFGSFDGNVGAKAGEETGSTINLGKVFSTGVAAQNLTKGIGEAERASASQKCYDSFLAIYKIMDEEQRKKVDFSAVISSCDYSLAN